MRANLELDIQRPMRPASDRAAPADSEAVVVDVEPSLSSDLEQRVRDWDYIGTSVSQCDLYIYIFLYLYFYKF